MASYVLTADIWFRQGEVEQTRHVKGDVLEDLTDVEVRNLSRAGAIAEAKSDAGKRATERAEAAPAPVDPTATPTPTGHQQAEYGTALANSGLGPEDATGGELTDEQWNEELELAEQRAASAAGTQAAPAKSATVDEWRRWAVQSGKASADQAEGMNKGELQALK